MFEYFPSNPGWTLSVGCCLSMGGEISEVHEACKPLVPLAEAPLDVANEAWFQSWMSISERVKSQGDELLAKGWEFSAGARYYRAAQYGFVAERHKGWKDPRKLMAYRRASALFAKGVKLLGHRTERIEIPFGDAVLAGYLRLPEGDGPFPTVILFNGFDGIKEMQYGFAGDEAVKRGIAVLFMDQEGTGESARLYGTTKPSRRKSARAPSSIASSSIRRSTRTGSALSGAVTADMMRLAPPSTNQGLNSVSRSAPFTTANACVRDSRI